MYSCFFNSIYRNYQNYYENITESYRNCLSLISFTLYLHFSTHTSFFVYKLHHAVYSDFYFIQIFSVVPINPEYPVYTLRCQEMAPPASSFFTFFNPQALLQPPGIIRASNLLLLRTLKCYEPPIPFQFFVRAYSR